MRRGAAPMSPRRKQTIRPRFQDRHAEERAIADAEVEAAASTLAVLERRLDKTILRAPADGVVSVIVAEVGENVRAGQPVLAIAGNRQAVSVVQCTRGFAARPHGGRESPCTAIRRGRRSPLWSPRCAHWARSRPGRPSARLAVTTAIPCDCASICRAIRRLRAGHVGLA